MAESILATRAKHAEFPIVKRASSKPTYIYGMADPATGELRYVGKTVASLAKRLKNHIGDASRRKSKCRAANWIRRVLASGSIPEIFEIEVVPAGGDWVEAEMHWIAVMKFYGCRLTNSAIGGQGTDGYKFTHDQRVKLREAHLGIKRSAEAHEKYMASMREKKLNGWKKPRRSKEEIERQFATRKKNREAGLHKPRRKMTDEEKRRASVARIACDSPQMRLNISSGRRRAIAARLAQQVPLNHQIPLNF